MLEVKMGITINRISHADDKLRKVNTSMPYKQFYSRLIINVACATDVLIFLLAIWIKSSYYPYFNLYA